MKWFKHLANASEDQKISELEDEFGLEGYAVFFKTLEFIAQEMDEKDDAFVRYSVQKLKRKLGISVQKLTKIYDFLDGIGLFFVKKEEAFLTIECSNLLKLRDEYTARTNRKSGQDPDKVPQYKEKEEEVKSKSKKEEKENIEVKNLSLVPRTRTKKNYSEEFEVMWKSFLPFNRKGDNKADAQKRYNKAKKDGFSQEQIKMALRSLAELNKSREPEYWKGWSTWLYGPNIKSSLAGESMISELSPVAKMANLSVTERGLLELEAEDMGLTMDELMGMPDTVQKLLG